MRYLLCFLCLFAVALVTTLAVTPLARRLAIRLDAVDYPSARRINTEPIPRMGGIAIFAGIAAAFLVVIVGTALFDWPAMLVTSSAMNVDYVLLAVSFVVIFATGLVDDKVSLRPWQKLTGQAVAATIAVASGLIIGDITNPFEAHDVIELGWVAYPVTVLYLVSYVNIINLIDGLDGLAAGISAIASLTMFVLALAAGRVDSAVLSLAVVGASLGFLNYNFHPASIFMGDSGSLTLGFALGVASLLSVTRVAGLTTIIVPLVVAAVPIIDTLSAIVRRLRAHVSIGQADKGHIHHRLMSEGFDQRQTVLLIYAWTALMCVGAIVMTLVITSARVVIFCVLLVLSGVFAARLHLLEPVLRHHYDPSTGEDELVGPGDEAFEEAAARDRERGPHLPGPGRP